MQEGRVRERDKCGLNDKRGPDKSSRRERMGAGTHDAGARRNHRRMKSCVAGIRDSRSRQRASEGDVQMLGKGKVARAVVFHLCSHAQGISTLGICFDSALG